MTKIYPSPNSFKKKYQNLDFNDKALFYFTLIIIVCVSLFIPIRYYQQEFNLVITNTVTVLMAVVVNLLLLYGKPHLSRSIFVTFMSTVMIVMIYQNGAKQLNWTYPGSAMLFFSLKPNAALKTNMAIVTIIGVLVWNELSISHWLQDILSLSCSILIVYTFCYKVDQQLVFLRNALNASLTDPLSGLSNRRCFDQDIDSLHSHPEPNTHYFLMMIDIDFFKEVNDVHGHGTGDAIIKHLALTLTTKLREGEQAYRVGGEEFAAIILAESLNDAVNRAENLRSTVENAHYISKSHYIRYTISIGLSHYQGDPTRCYQEADSALYIAKKKGRNNIQPHPTAVQTPPLALQL